MAETKKGAKIRQGSDVSQTGAEELESRRAAGGEITSNGVFTKVLRDGKVQIIPTSEVYAKEPSERVEGVEVHDPTVLGAAALLSHRTMQDRLEREFNTQERGDAVSAHHAQGAAGTITREAPVPVKLEKGAYEKDQQERQRQVEKNRAAAQKEAEKAEAEESEDEEGGFVSADFDPSNPEATTLAELEGALEGASDDDVKKAKRKDGRAGAVSIYERRLGK